MKIYLASSWKNARLVRETADLLRRMGHLVDAFCDESSGRLVFNFDALTDVEHQTLNARSALDHPIVQEAFAEDKSWLDWADGVVMILPCGNGDHLEAGYAVGKGKPVWVFAPYGFPPGEKDVMYGFFRVLTDGTGDLVASLREWEQGGKKR